MATKQNLYHVEVYRWIKVNGKRKKTYSFNSRIFSKNIQEARRLARNHYDDKAYIIKVRAVK